MNSVKYLIIFTLSVVNSFKILPRIQNVTKTVGLLFPQVTVSKFPPFIEPVVQRIQASQSSYVFQDQSRPVSNYTLSPEDEIYFGIASTTEIYTTTPKDEEITDDTFEYVDVPSSTEKLYEKFQSDIDGPQNIASGNQQSTETNDDNLAQFFSNTGEDLDSVNCEWSESVVNVDGSELSQTNMINADNLNLVGETIDKIQNSGVDYGLPNVVHKDSLKNEYKTLHFLDKGSMDGNKQIIELEASENEEFAVNGSNLNEISSGINQTNKIAKSIEDSTDTNKVYYYGAARPNKNVPYSEVLDVVIDDINDSVIVGDVSEVLITLTTKKPPTEKPESEIIEQTTKSEDVELSSLPNLIISNTEKLDGNYGLPSIIYVKNLNKNQDKSI